jgi:hypothetical protein
MTELTAIGTRLLSDGKMGPVLERAVVPSEEGTLLAVVPIPGSGTSLAIVGYAVPTGSAAGPPADAGEPEAGLREGTPRQEAGEEVDGLYLDYEQRRVWVQGSEIPLTFQEWELLAFLVGRPSRVFSRTELLGRVWQRDLEATSRTVDVHVSRLRQKLGDTYGKCLVTEYRVGYQYRPV